MQNKDQTAELASYCASITARAGVALQAGELTTKNLNDSTQRIFSRKGIDPCQLQNRLHAKS